MSDKTQHSYNTEHGYNTEHKLPANIKSDLDVVNDLSVQLYPTGRAWYRTEGGDFNNFHKALNTSFVRLINNAKSIIDSTFPDNQNFTKEDATLWEWRLGLLTDTTLDLQFRRDNIKRKISYSAKARNRQHHLFIQNQLRLSGFDVYVHENVKPYKTPDDLAGVNLSEIQHADNIQHSISSQHGGHSFNVVANSIDEIEEYAVGDGNLWATFFIGGEILGTFADVKESRLREFKELVIKLKPAHTVAFTFINFI